MASIRNVAKPPLVNRISHATTNSLQVPQQLSRRHLGLQTTEQPPVIYNEVLNTNFAEMKQAWKLTQIPKPILSGRLPYWQKISRWKDVGEDEFLSYRWQVLLFRVHIPPLQQLTLSKIKNTVDRKDKLLQFLESELPERIPPPKSSTSKLANLKTRADFLADVLDGMKVAPMAVRLTPHILSVIDWRNPLDDPIRRQFVPLKSTLVKDHPALELDSLHETDDSPVPGLVHRYPEKVLFLGE